MKKSHAVTLYVLLCCTAGAALGQVAEVKNYGDALVLTPVTEYEQIIFTVTGPCNYYQRDVITDGEAIFRLDETTIDGRYRFQLVVIPSIDSGIVEVLQDARKSGNNSKVDQLCRDGKLPGDPLTQAAGFGIFRGEIVYDPDTIEKELGDFDSGASMAELDTLSSTIQLSAAPTTAASPFPTKDVVFNDDLIVIGSTCVGFDCINGEVFSFDTIRLKENNLRIKFDDTSTSASFPRTDWQLTANDSANGGLSKFSIDDVTNSRTPFTVEGAAPSHSLYVDSSGRIGRKTSNPVLEAHLVDGDTPALRLEQDTSSGFGAQTWDIAGNETNFFVRDATNGSTLPLRIFPGSPSNRLVIDGEGQVGIGTTSADASLEVVEATATPSQPMLLLNNTAGPPRLEQTNGAGGHTWRQTVTGTGEYNVDDTLDGTIELSLAQNGNLTISGNILTTNCPAGCGPDYVFAPDYDLLSLDELAAFIAENSHLPNVPSAKEMETTGINMTQLQLRMLEKIEELTLYTLTQHRTIQELQTRLEAIETTE